MPSDLFELTLPDGRTIAVVRERDLLRIDEARTADRLVALVLDAVEPDALASWAAALGHAPEGDDREALARWLTDALVRGDVVAVDLDAPPRGVRPVPDGGEPLDDWSDVVPLHELRRDPPTTQDAWVAFRVVDVAGRPLSTLNVQLHFADRPSASARLDAAGLLRVDDLDPSTRLRVELPARRELPGARERGTATAAAPAEIPLRARPGTIVQLPDVRTHYRIVIAEPPRGFSA
ncbi:MAG: hypothetical protein K1X88_12235 [Nannocystaceae bacterium]|nr:hypothetical protein [Nannocystaceae bacterium]